MLTMFLNLKRCTLELLFDIELANLCPKVERRIAKLIAINRLARIGSFRYRTRFYLHGLFMYYKVNIKFPISADRVFGAQIVGSPYNVTATRKSKLHT